QAGCRSPGWEMPRRWVASSVASGRSMPPSPATMREASLFSVSRSERRVGAATDRTATVDAPERTKDNRPYDGTERDDQAYQAAQSFDDDAQWRGFGEERCDAGAPEVLAWPHARCDGRSQEAGQTAGRYGCSGAGGSQGRDAGRGAGARYG